MRVDPTRVMLQFLFDSGVLTGKDIVSQRDKLVETEVADNNRLFFVKGFSPSGDRSTSRSTLTFALMGKVNNNDLPNVKEYAYEIYDELLKFDCADYIVSIEPLTGVNGPYTMESNRDVYDMEFLVNVETGVILT